MIFVVHILDFLTRTGSVCSCPPRTAFLWIIVFANSRQLLLSSNTLTPPSSVHLHHLPLPPTLTCSRSPSGPRAWRRSRAGCCSPRQISPRSSWSSSPGSSCRGIAGGGEGGASCLMWGERLIPVLRLRTGKAAGELQSHWLGREMTLSSLRTTYQVTTHWDTVSPPTHLLSC